jgi:hypothetical protein
MSLRKPGRTRNSAAIPIIIVSAMARAGMWPALTLLRNCVSTEMPWARSSKPPSRAAPITSARVGSSPIV